MPTETPSGPSLRFMHRHGMPCSITTTDASVDYNSDWDDTSYTSTSVETVCLLGAMAGSASAERDEATSRLATRRDITIPATVLTENPSFQLADAETPLNSIVEVDDFVKGLSGSTPTASDADTATDTTMRYEVIGFTRVMGGLVLDCSRVERN